MMNNQLRLRRFINKLTLMVFVCSAQLIASELPIYSLTIENHLFFPARLDVPSDTKFKLEIKNNDSSIEEFDSFDLNREKVIFPGRKAVLYVGPLTKGEYHFFGEYNRSTAIGTLVAVDKAQITKKETDNAH